jgi:hypothetical protein
MKPERNRAVACRCLVGRLCNHDPCLGIATHTLKTKSENKPATAILRCERHRTREQRKVSVAIAMHGSMYWRSSLPQVNASDTQQRTAKVMKQNTSALAAVCQIEYSNDFMNDGPNVAAQARRA